MRRLSAVLALALSLAALAQPVPTCDPGPKGAACQCGLDPAFCRSALVSRMTAMDVRLGR